jgi:ATP-dependent DNA ligase
MEAKHVDELPAGTGWQYEPKWDGFRAICFKDEAGVTVTSRKELPFNRYFPEIVAAVEAVDGERCVLDGEIVIFTPDGKGLDFDGLLQRIHPAESRVRRLAKETPASFIAFDLMRRGDEDLLTAPFRERRAALERTFSAARDPLHLTPITRDETLAREWFERFEGAGLDGIIAKDGEHPYRPNVRTMFKVKHQRTVDCVVCGYRLHKTEPDAIGSLLLGLYDDGEGPSWAESFGGLLPIGATASFPMARRRELLTELRPLEIDPADHPWRRGLGNERDGNRWNPAREQQFVALSPERVIEVRYDHMDGGFFRHPATFLRWRPDRDPASCGFAQLERPAGFDVGEIL